jgi:hypothetical protein
MVNGERSLSQDIFGLPFTVYCLPDALRSALGALRQGAVHSRVRWVRILDLILDKAGSDCYFA